MSNNLSAIQLEEISWENGKRAASLNRVYSKVTEAARSASTWYQKNKRPKKWGAMFLRWGAVLLISISGLLPLVSSLARPGAEQPAIDPLFTSLAVAVAAALFGLDKFFNYSNGWMRYVKTDLALRTTIGEFEMEWQIARAAWAAPEPTVQETADMLARCKAFAARVNAIESEETNLWIAEFQASLAQLGESVKAERARDVPRQEPTPPAAPPVKPGTPEPAQAKGGVKVTVQHEGQTWSGPVKLRSGPDEEYREFTAVPVALADLAAGKRKVSVEVVAGGKVFRGEVDVDVVAGQTADATVAADTPYEEPSTEDA